MKRILLLAGEESGVLYAKKIAQKLRERREDIEIRGYEDYGFRIEDLAVFGIWAVVRKIGYFLRVKRTIERAIEEWQPDVVCTIDYPGMNLKLAAYAKAHGVRAVHVVCPQVWAWHQGRIPKIEASLDKLCCFLPFEPKIFKAGLAEFVGHPLVEEFTKGQIRDVRKEFDAGERVLAVLPGSRMGEIHYHMPILLAVARELRDRLGKLRLKVVIPAANSRVFKAIEGEIARAGMAREEFDLQLGKAREMLAKADAAVVSSGTATLEAALIGCPTVLVYKVSYLLGEFLRRAIKGTKYVGLANVIWDRCSDRKGRQPMPEFLQEKFTVGNVVGSLFPWLTDEAENRMVRKVLSDTAGQLNGDGDSIAEIARILL